MASSNSSGAVIGAVPPPYLSPADVAAHAAASHVRRVPVPPPYLSPKGAAALDRLLTVVAVDRAVVRYETAAARYDELIARPAHTLSGAEFDAIGAAQQTLAESFEVLAAAGQHHLVVTR